MGKPRLNDLLNTLSGKLDLDKEERKQYQEALQQDLQEPVKVIGTGQTGVGKSTLLRSVFAIEENADETPEWLTTDATSAETEEFRSFQIETEQGFKVEFTDGPGLGESIQKDKELLPKWIEQIQQHDLLYWVIDASSRDISHIQQNMKKILDETGYEDRIVVVLNKVDQIELEREDLEDDEEGWNEEFNVPTPALEEQIERRSNDLVEKLSRHTGISKDQIVSCSALKRWNHGEVLDTMIEYLPPEKQIKLSLNRDVKDFTELMSDEALAEAQQELESQSGGSHYG